MRLSNLADYAVVVMIHAAQARDARISAQGVAANTGLPAPTVAKIMGQLSRAGLLESRRGPSGGFQLARGPEQISVAAITEAVDGPIAMTACVDTATSDCGFETVCCMKSRWPIINRAVREALDRVTLADLVRPSFDFLTPAERADARTGNL
ncbi:SUF system Fe-S cluster assembly regulator [Hankyongella ginsenosidimutans]|uniref:SUF system Fe-S cluster assembly regulator n=1 Tax=Hankyongella ginsenosidimutans TaxID=1763828 RepID=A0A4D7C117_9SPHN|nr:SUF system Fe-S cluster assembly regulator [Hankyongella ginsenosidimutans]QCI79404.1 SUF system Fe-S cluster assembly regulator [Hankyongella ginsenosidimutans]